MDLPNASQLACCNFDKIGSKNSHVFGKFIDWFVQNSTLMKILPEEDKLGIFIYSKEKDRIVCANHQFLQTYQISIERLNNSAIRRLIFMKLHKDDARYIRFLEWNASQNKQSKPINRVVRLRQKDQSYKPLHLLVFSIANIDRSLSDYRLGIVINVPEFWSEQETVDPHWGTYRDKTKRLSKREKEIVELIVDGATDKEIGNYLNISPHTAQRHRKNILKKLEFKNTAKLAFIIGKYRLV